MAKIAEIGHLLDEALGGRLNEDQQRLAAISLQRAEKLLRKNTDYGSTGLKSPKLAPHIKPSDAILVRMSDKIARAETLAQTGRQLVEESFEDTLDDLAGYITLYQVARHYENAQAKPQPPVAGPAKIALEAFRGHPNDPPNRTLSAAFDDRVQAAVRSGNLDSVVCQPTADHRG